MENTNSDSAKTPEAPPTQTPEKTPEAKNAPVLSAMDVVKIKHIEQITGKKITGKIEDKANASIRDAYATAIRNKL